MKDIEQVPSARAIHLIAIKDNRIIDLKHQVEKMKETLEWYANAENHDWEIDSFDDVIQSKAMEDEGERARNILSHLGENKE